MRYETASITRQGDRAENQDRCAVAGSGTAFLLLLADGMGGHPRGELAAQVFIDSLLRQFDEQREPVAPEFLPQAFTRAHADIIAAGQQAMPPVEPCTTGVACLVGNGTACWAHVGDSRLYLLRNDAIQARTRDHSYVEELIQLGELAEADREQHPLRNYVTQALGGSAGPPEVTLTGSVTLEPGDVLLLCSDGLWAALPETRLLELAGAGSLQAAVEKLAVTAEGNSSPLSDNVTLLALRTST
ncbi:MAG: protein phosphatase 2C domain-containing protein [Pseudomonadota bacterium]